MDDFNQILETEKMPSKKNYRKFLIKTIVSICLFSACFVMKTQFQAQTLPAWNAIESAVSSGVDCKAAFHEIGNAIQSGRPVLPVFQSFVSDLFFYREPQQPEEVLPVVNAADLSIELLSFEMSNEELQDDTEAVQFVFPGATADTTLTFPHTTPLYGVVTSPFGYRNHPILQRKTFHSGIDIAGAMNDPIGAFADGTVLEVGYSHTYGNYVLVLHEGDYRSFYAHASKLLVKKGQRVSIGQTIAQVGSTGLSTGPHLHFEVRKGSTRLNPAQFIIPNP